MQLIYIYLDSTTKCIDFGAIFLTFLDLLSNEIRVRHTIGKNHSILSFIVRIHKEEVKFCYYQYYFSYENIIYQS